MKSRATKQSGIEFYAELSAEPAPVFQMWQQVRLLVLKAGDMESDLPTINCSRTLK